MPSNLRIWLSHHSSSLDDTPPSIHCLANLGCKQTLCQAFYLQYLTLADWYLKHLHKHILASTLHFKTAPNL